MTWVGDVRIPHPNHGGTLADPETLFVVAHTLECDAIPGLAVSLSQGYFQNNPVSVHCVNDPTLTVAGLGTNTRAYHAGPVANAHGLADEVTGRASWTRNQWLVGNPNKALQQQAKAMAQLARSKGFTPADYRWLSVAEVQSLKVRGFCYHYDISRAFKQSTHYDPGPGYPADIQMTRIRYYAGPDVANHWGLKDSAHPDTPTADTAATGGAQPEIEDHMYLFFNTAEADGSHRVNLTDGVFWRHITSMQQLEFEIWRLRDVLKVPVKYIVDGDRLQADLPPAPTFDAIAQAVAAAGPVPNAGLYGIEVPAPTV